MATMIDGLKITSHIPPQIRSHQTIRMQLSGLIQFPASKLLRSIDNGFDISVLFFGSALVCGRQSELLMAACDSLISSLRKRD